MSQDLHRLAKLLGEGEKIFSGLRGMLKLVAGPEPAAPDDPYRILGVERGDPLPLIKRVYRAKAAVLHPDTKETGNEEAYKRLQWAYQQVMNHPEGGAP